MSETVRNGSKRSIVAEAKCVGRRSVSSSQLEKKAAVEQTSSSWLQLHRSTIPGQMTLACVHWVCAVMLATIHQSINTKEHSATSNVKRQRSAGETATAVPHASTDTKIRLEYW